jgi:peptidoglycan/xylan/chitin deacetylase (PgdA/CDA1 family)
MKSALAVAGAVCAIMIAGGAVFGFTQRPHPVTVPLDAHAVSVAGPLQPLHNSAANGHVVFTFDDGPDSYTPALLAEMRKLNLRGVFFEFGWKVAAHPEVVREQLAAGDVIENHTWDHPSFTGESPRSRPLTAATIKAELESTQRAIVAAGAPKPTLYRPPFGDITPADNEIAARLGLRIVEPFSVEPNGNIVDSRDWVGISATQIAHNVEYGYWGRSDHRSMYLAGLIQGARVIGFHDSGPESCARPSKLCLDVINTIRALPLIVAWMNLHQLGVTTNIPPGATGGAVPNIPVSKQLPENTVAAFLLPEFGAVTRGVGGAEAPGGPQVRARLAAGLRRLHR